MNQAIVITSIFQPTEAVIKCSQLNKHALIVVGDKKTPPDWHYNNAVFLSVDNKESARFNIYPVLPYNHYCRKMLGYLYAMKNGAAVIIDTDDDNIPKDDWFFPKPEGIYNSIIGGKGFVNIYKYFTKQHIWPRGLPLNAINRKVDFGEIAKQEIKVGVWQGLADEDPDVDAIYRLTSDKPCFFEDKEPVVLEKNTIAPFNTQNTMVRKELFPLLYLPTSVTFRFTDILRGLIAQPIMWLYGYHLGFVKASVIQKRNPHDYFKDFISEIPMYQHCENVIDIVNSAISGMESINNNLFSAYRELKNNGIVMENELITLEAWLKDIEEK
jgi:hypothetical protein